MKRIFYHSDRFEVYRIRDMLEQHGIDCFIKNELLQGAVGDVPPHEAEIEVWLIDADWEKKATQLINDFTAEQDALKHISYAQWKCIECDEINEPNFNVCWNCQTGKALDHLD